MTKIYDRIIIGAGTTAVVYLSFFPPQDNEEVTVIGTEEPWMRRGKHRMGQPPHLLMLPQLTSMRPDDFPSYSEIAEAASKNSAPESPFLRSDIYAKQIFTLPQHKSKKIDNVKYRRAKVTSVLRDGKDLKVSYQYIDTNQLKYLHAKQVIVATGAGSPNSRTIPEAAKRIPDIFFDGDSYLNEGNKLRGKIVAIEGGSATAAWCAEKALLAGAERVYWFVRPDPKVSFDQRFEGAFPAGDRNEWLRGHPYVSRFLGTYNENKVKFDGDKLILNFDEHKNAPVIVDQYIAAIGAEEAAQYLDDSLRNNLKPIIDERKHLHTDGDAILAFSSLDKSIIVLGAGVFKLPKNLKSEKYVKSNQYLPLSARPPEGIPTIIATIAALTHYLERGASRWVDINLANFSDLDAYVYSFAGILQRISPDVDLNLIVQFITDQIIGNRIMKGTPYGITIKELKRLYGNLLEYANGPSLKGMISAYGMDER